MQNSVELQAGVTQLDTIKHEYAWVIKNFICAMNLELTSPIFYTSAMKLNWKVQMKTVRESDVFLGLVLDSRNDNFDQPIRVKVQFSFVNHVRNQLFLKTDFTHTFIKNGDSKESLISGDLEAMKYKAYPDGDLFVHCSLTVYTGSVSNVDLASPNQLECTDFKNVLFEDFEKLLNDKTYSDVILETGKTKFHAHKAILAVRSPVFYTMFNNDMIKKKENKVVIDDVKPEVLSEMLCYIYTGKVGNTYGIEEELFQLADRYLLEGLKSLSSRAVINKLSAENVIDTFVWSDLIGALNVKEKALNFIATHKKDVMNTQGFKSLMDSQSELKMEILKTLV